LIQLSLLTLPSLQAFIVVVVINITILLIIGHKAVVIGLTGLTTLTSDVIGH